MAVITRHLGAVAAVLRVLNLEQNTLTLELLFQDGRVMSPAEAKYPEKLVVSVAGRATCGNLSGPANGCRPDSRSTLANT
jgi:hypothetical protein